MEKTIITGKLVNIKAIALSIFALLAIIPSLIVFLIEYDYYKVTILSWDMNWDWVIEDYGKNATAFSISLQNSAGTMVLIALGAAVLAFVFYLIFSKTELTVTDKRVYGKTVFGKRVDLPFDSISAVGTALMKSIAVTTSSGAIKFALIANSNEVHSVVSNLLIERQSKPTATAAPVVKQEIPQSNAEELKKYKELLDMGVITQEEFDAKKKQLLGL